MKEIINRRLVAGMIAGAIALSGCATTEQATPSFSQSFEVPSPTIIFSPNSTIEVTPMPTPSVEPTIVPSPTPEKTPVPNINKIKVDGGKIDMGPIEAAPYYDLQLYAMTVVAIKENTKDNSVLIGLTSAGKKITEQYSGSGFNGKEKLYTISGATLWVEIAKDSPTYDPIAGVLIGQGAKGSMPYLKVGSVLRWVSIDTQETSYSYWGDTPSRRVKNRSSAAKLVASVGKSFPRTDERFFFYVGGLNVYQGTDIVNP